MTNNPVVVHPLFFDVLLLYCTKLKTVNRAVVTSSNRIKATQLETTIKKPLCIFRRKYLWILVLKRICKKKKLNDQIKVKSGEIKQVSQAHSHMNALATTLYFEELKHSSTEIESLLFEDIEAILLDLSQEGEYFVNLSIAILRHGSTLAWNMRIFKILNSQKFITNIAPCF